MRGIRGFHLGGVLLLASLIIVLGFTLAGGSVAHLHLARSASNEVQALNLARSVVNLAIDRVFDGDNSFGASREPSSSLEAPLQGVPPGAVGQLTFNEAKAAEWGIPISTNLVAGAGAVEVWGGRSLPPGTVHLVGVGRCGRTVRTVEAVFRVGLFPQAILFSGPLVSTGDLTVASYDPIRAAQSLQPADVVSNAAGTAVNLGPDSLVTGDVQTVGEVQLDSTATVQGEVREGEKAVSIPTFDLTRFDPEGKVTVQPLAPGSYPDDPMVLVGAVKCAGGDLDIAGDLRLDGSLLYVADGKLTIQGGLTGTGFVVARRGLEVLGGANLDAASRLAMLSGGETTLRGAGAASSYLKGLVYSRGSLHVDQITVVGSLVVDGTGADVADISQARVWYDPQAAEVTLGGATGSVNPNIYLWMPDFRYDGLVDLARTPPALVVTDPLQANAVVGTFDLPANLQPDPAALLSFLAGLVRANAPALSEAEVNNYATMHQGVVGAKLAEMRAAGGGNTQLARTFRLEPSEVLKPNERIRLMLWRES